VLKLSDADEAEIDGVGLGVGTNPEPDDDTVTLDDTELPPLKDEGLVVSVPDVPGTVTVLDPVLLSPVTLDGSGINKLLLPLTDSVVTTDADLAVDVALPLPLTDVLVTRDVAVTVTVTSPLVVDVEFVPGGQL
jgi:hypothetical protein